MTDNKKPAPRNKTLRLTAQEREQYSQQLITLSHNVAFSDIKNKTINQDLFLVLDWLPTNCVDLLFLDPPYNLTKVFNQRTFTQRPLQAYQEWFKTWFVPLLPVLKSTAAVYVCGDWRSSAALHQVLEQHLVVRNRITWEREKGRGAHTNWKNCSEDIWFCTVSDDYVFNVEAVKLKRQVIAPYTDGQGQPKDWDNIEGNRYRFTFPSNLWTDITVPFWSMSENTEHPTQKPEKLVAKVLLASTNPGDTVLDPFLGSGTTSVVAKKLGRHYIGIEQDTYYCCLAQKRLEQVEDNNTIQGYADGVFWERNSQLKR